MKRKIDTGNDFMKKLTAQGLKMMIKEATTQFYNTVKMAEICSWCYYYR